LKRNSIQDIFQNGFDGVKATTVLPVHCNRAGTAITKCRTGAYGHHIESCEQGCTQQVRYHSCHHRSCPQCNALPRERWLEAQRTRLLDCAHYHIVFTLPAALRRFWRYHKAEVADDIFRAAKEALLRLCRKSLYLGGTPGILAGFHSWSRTLDDHPHLHCLVSAEGITEQGEWVKAKRECFLPGKLLMATFRVLLLRRWLRRNAQGQWHAALGDPACLEVALKRQYAQGWHVQVQPRYRHGRGVAVYLARYLRGGPCHARQVQRDAAGRVLFTPKRGERKAGVRHFTEAGFIERYLAHVPPHRQRMVRGYGVYAGQGRAVALRNASRPVEAPEPRQRSGVAEIPFVRCPHCGEPLQRPSLPWLLPHGPP